jgi:hypothetical protein
MVDGGWLMAYDRHRMAAGVSEERRMIEDRDHCGLASGIAHPAS